MKKYRTDRAFLCETPAGFPAMEHQRDLYLVSDVEQNLAASLQLLEQIKQRDLRIAELEKQVHDLTYCECGGTKCDAECPICDNDE